MIWSMDNGFSGPPFSRSCSSLSCLRFFRLTSLIHVHSGFDLAPEFSRWVFGWLTTPHNPTTLINAQVKADKGTMEIVVRSKKESKGKKLPAMTHMPPLEQTPTVDL